MHIKLSFLCLRRGVSKTKYYDAYQIIFSLLTQRCFRLFRNHVVIEILFSAYAEVFPLSASVLRSERPFLCLRRGVSLEAVIECVVDPLFSAYAEVFPHLRPVQRHWMTFLCLRRGVSSSTGCFLLVRHFSLPTQRCFFRPLHRRLLQGLFSAYAEVFPPQKRASSIFFSFLCLRRGVSDWGIGRVRRDWLFSAYAEVFPPPHGYRESPSPFLCLRRGVSCLTNVRFC